MRQLVLTAFAVTCFGGAAVAADLPVKAPVATPAPVFVWEFGARYWYSSGRNAYDYYADPVGATRISRLDYDGLDAHSGEAFFRMDAPMGLFLKGYAGGGKIVSGNLYDEDFPPLFTPYSKTISDTSGSLGYASLDAGYSFYDSRRTGAGPAIRIGGFVGYHYWRETVDAKGCAQIGGGNVCAPGDTLPTSVTVITEKDTWNALRLGAVVDVWFTRDIKLTAEAAYARVWQDALDIHYFTFGPDPASGDGNGVHLEAVLSYQVTPLFNVGVGGRWWHYETEATDAFNQLLKYKTDRYGVFFQGSLKLDDPAVRTPY